MNESELYKELGILTKDRDRWKESIPYRWMKPISLLAGLINPFWIVIRIIGIVFDTVNRILTIKRMPLIISLIVG